MSASPQPLPPLTSWLKPGATLHQRSQPRNQRESPEKPPSPEASPSSPSRTPRTPRLQPPETRMASPWMVRPSSLCSRAAGAAVRGSCAPSLPGRVRPRRQLHGGFQPATFTGPMLLMRGPPPFQAGPLPKKAAHRELPLPPRPVPGPARRGLLAPGELLELRLPECPAPAPSLHDYTYHDYGHSSEHVLGMPFQGLLRACNGYRGPRA